MMNSSVWMMLASRWHLSATVSRIVMMEVTRWAVTFQCLIALRENLSARECLWVWAVQEGDAFCNDSDVMATMTAVTGPTKRTAQRNRLAAHQMSSNVMMDDAFR